MSVRRLLAAIFVVVGCAELAYVIVNISAMPVYITALHLDVRWVGAIGTVYLVAEGVLKSPFGALGDRIGRKTLILFGPIVSTFTALTTPYVHDPMGLAGLRMLDGMGAAALWPSAFSLIGDHVREARRAAAMSLFNLAYILALAIGPAIGGNLDDWVHHGLHVPIAQSKQASFYVASMLFFLTALVAATVVPGGRVAAAHHEALPEEGGLSLASFWGMVGRMPWTLLMAFVTFLGIGCVMLYVKVFAMAPFGPFRLTESQFGDYLLIPALCIALASVPLGTLGDRIGKPRAVRIGIGACAAAFWLLIAYPTVWTLVAMGTVIGAGFVLAFPAWMALISAQSGAKQRGAVIGAVGTAQGLGAILGASVSGYLYKMHRISLGLFTVPRHGMGFLACAVLLTISFVLALTTLRFAPRKRRPGA